ncbi:MAG: hypothetical protein K2L17_06670 [Muribaculaceae bacterium]|nr:hypothetical protein [Muribaculaceae bacterium]
MKNILLTLTASLFACIFVGDLKAQDRTYLPVLELGKEWTIRVYHYYWDPPVPDDSHGGKIIETIEEDGHEVFVFHPIYMDLPEDPNVAMYYIHKAYEEDGVVWFFSSEDQDYIPMINFNLEVGDAFLYGMEVAWKERVVIEGVERCVMAIQNSSSKIVDYWIEGIGAVGDTYFTPSILQTSVSSRIIECRMGDKCLFDYDQIDKYLSSEVRSLKDDNDIDTALYDILGRRISTPAAGQLYIQGGKKYIGR